MQSGQVPALAYSVIHEQLVQAVPEFEHELAAHLEENFGKPLPHVLFGDLTRFVLAAYAAGDADLVERCLRFLEEAMGASDNMVRNLVQVSFVENVRPWDPAMELFVGSWQALLRAEAERQCNWKPGDPGPASIH